MAECGEMLGNVKTERTGTPGVSNSWRPAIDSLDDGEIGGHDSPRGYKPFGARPCVMRP